ncbi:MAG: 30S ribosomal protein S2 [Candidatus Marinimicrobia bacterium]|jgi:small subunit ribosomal protein S2|nr:30S ribosomal protein S2 [Candidatus Neomarinimicrobiota bacterium]
MQKITKQDLLNSGAHFGHVSSKTDPNFKDYVISQKNGIDIINLDHTLDGLEKALQSITNAVEKNGEILFVGTKKHAKDVIQQEADRCGMFYVVERWLGGTLTNFSTVKKSIKRLHSLEKEGSTVFEDLTKKEILKLNREKIKLSDQHRGIKDMKRLPNMIVIVDGKTESIAIKEAQKLEIPIVCIVDSNTDPALCTYPIPANDDSIRTIQLLVTEIANAIIEVAQKNKKTEEAQEAEATENKVEEKKEA